MKYPMPARIWQPPPYASCGRKPATTPLQMLLLGEGPSSGGLTSEVITLFHAVGLHKVGAGGGTHAEEIIVHEVPLAEVRRWLEERSRQGCLIDLRIYAGLYLTNLII